MVGYVYKITNKIDGRFYIGSTINFENRKKKHIKDLTNSKHHNIFLQRAFNKYGIDVFEFSFKEKIVKDLKELQNLEERYINFCWNCGKLYNLSKKACGGDLISYHPNNKEYRELQSKLVKERYSKMTECEKKERSIKLIGKNNPNYGNRWNDEQRKKASDRMKNKDNKFFQLYKGKNFEEIFGEEKAKEIKENISKRSKEYIGDKNPFYGKKHTEETKRKLSEKRIGVVNENSCKKVLYNGVIYCSASECARQLGLKNVTVSYRAKNNIYGFSYVGENDNLEQRNAKHMWTKEECESIAKTCKTKKEFSEKNPRAYDFARRSHLMEELSKRYFDELRHYWTLDEILELSKKYNSYSEFRKNEINAYSSLSRHAEWKEIIKNNYINYKNDLWLKENLVKP